MLLLLAECDLPLNTDVNFALTFVAADTILHNVYGRIIRA